MTFGRQYKILWHLSANLHDMPEPATVVSFMELFYTCFKAGPYDSGISGDEI